MWRVENVMGVRQYLTAPASRGSSERTEPSLDSSAMRRTRDFDAVEFLTAFFKFQSAAFKQMNVDSLLRQRGCQQNPRNSRARDAHARAVGLKALRTL